MVYRKSEIPLAFLKKPMQKSIESEEKGIRNEEWIQKILITIHYTGTGDMGMMYYHNNQNPLRGLRKLSNYTSSNENFFIEWSQRYPTEQQGHLKWSRLRDIKSHHNLWTSWKSEGQGQLVYHLLKGLEEILQQHLQARPSQQNEHTHKTSNFTTVNSKVSQKNQLIE